MKKIITGSIIATSLVLGGCATSVPYGAFYTKLDLPVTATSNTGSAMKVGVASCKSILAIVATGDCSIETAKKNGGITEVHHVDWKAENTLGIIGNYQVVVYGN
ncbi:MAG: TRL-like protein family [Nitrococcus mobilis]|nr:TRL-like protein family [Nitrococcus mobilis]